MAPKARRGEARRKAGVGAGASKGSLLGRITSRVGHDEGTKKLVRENGASFENDKHDGHYEEEGHAPREGQG